MRALVTNDDGVDSTGIRALALAAKAVGLEVTVAAPAWDSSGASASLTGVQLDGRLLFESRPEWGTGPVFGVEAAPAFIVRAAVHGAFGDPPDIVLSGVNNGPNTGHAILHSGTVGAVLTASTFGRPGVAFSLGASATPQWDTAEAIAATVLRWVVESPRQLVLNVNIPNVALGDVKGIVPARLAAFGAVQTNLTEVGEGYVKFAFTEIEAEYEDGTDAAALAQGYACYTALSAVCENEGADIAGLDQLQVSLPAH
jgi:5'-nucleotidase